MSHKFCSTPQWTDYLQLMEQRKQEFAPSEKLSIVTDGETAARFVEETGTPIGVLYKSAYRILVADLVQSPDGRLFAYERLLPAARMDSVAAVTVQGGKFVLLKQFRHALRTVQYAFPRGFGEPDLPPEENVKKEVREELGAEVTTLRFLGRMTADSGLSGGYTCVYVCEISQTKTVLGYEEIEGVVTLSQQELEEWIAAGRITDGFTLSAYSLFLCEKGRICSHK